MAVCTAGQPRAGSCCVGWVATQALLCPVPLCPLPDLVPVGHQRSVETASFSPDSKQLASGGRDKHVMLWEVQSGQMLHHLAGHQDTFQSSDFTPSSDCLPRAQAGQSMLIADVCKPLAPVTPPIFHQELEGNSGNISCLCLSASGLLASGSWDKTILIWKPSTRSLLVQLKGHITWVKSTGFSLELQLASAGYSHMVKVWDCSTGKCTETLRGVLDVAHACASTPDGKLLVSGAADKARHQIHHSDHPGPFECNITTNSSHTSPPASPCPGCTGPGVMIV
ncbi:WD repeat-containing protein 38 [Manis pentadactyla]|uniref:WD repeat-containing protein 38 n=1 Tax=Manis pentadactyla TaxID=143292 RepID=UPI00255C4AE7|nr:WD repeat-containing protein 38 [Manis pentadactyla]